MVGLRLQSNISVSVGQSLFPEGLLPWAASPSDSLLSTICAACFQQASPSPLTCPGHCNGSVVYCSDRCRELDLPLHFRSGECHLLAAITPGSDGHQGFGWKGPVEFPSLGGTCDLRVALRLLVHHEHLKNIDHFLAAIQHGGRASRLGGLLSNRSSLLLLHHYDDQRCCSEQEDEVQAISDELRNASLLMHHARYVMSAKELQNDGDAHAFPAMVANVEDLNAAAAEKSTAIFEDISTDVAEKHITIDAFEDTAKPQMLMDKHTVMKNDDPVESGKVVECYACTEKDSSTPTIISDGCAAKTDHIHFLDVHAASAAQCNRVSPVMTCTQTNARISVEEEMLLIQEVICQVYTNGVHVQVNQMAMPDDHFTMHLHYLGTAVYGPLFSWIDHSCRPNTFYSFALCTMIPATNTPEIPLVPDTCTEALGLNQFCSSHRTHNQVSREYGPRVYLHCIHNMMDSEHVWISYINLLEPKTQRKRELCLKYRFDCHCERCASQCYADEELQKIGLDDARFKTLMEDILQHESERATDLLLTNDDPWFCCQILERLLFWVLEESNERGLLTLKSVNNSLGQTLCYQETTVQKIHLMHHKCLDIYTSLTTSYRILASIYEHQDTAMSSVGTDRVQLKSSTQHSANFCLASAAYALVLAGSVHNLYESGEIGLIGITALLWQECGEAFLRLSKQSDKFYHLASSPMIDGLKDMPLSSSGMTNNHLKSKFEFVRYLATSLWLVMRSVSPFLSCILNPFSVGTISSLVVDNTETLNTREIWISRGRDVSMFTKCCFEYSSSLMTICYGNN